MGRRAVHGRRPSEAVRRRSEVLRTPGRAPPARRHGLRRRDQRLRGRCPGRPGAPARRVRGPRQDPAAVVGDGRDRRGVADRRNLRTRGRRRAPLRTARAGLRQALRQAGGPARLAGLPRAERPGGADHDPRQALPIRDGEPVLEARPGDAGPGLGEGGAGGAEDPGGRGQRVESLEPLRLLGPRDGASPGDPQPGARVELGARRRPRTRRPVIRSASSARRSATTSRRS